MTEDQSTPPPTETASERVVRLQGELSAASERVAKANAEVDRLNGKSMPPSPETVFDHANDSKLTQELGAVFDKAEAREEKRPEMPTIANERIEDRVARAHEWSEMSHKQRKVESDAADALAETRKIAAKFNLSLQEAEAFKQTQLLQENQQQANDYGPVSHHLKSAFRDSTPAESAAFFAQTKAGLDRDLIGGIAEIAGHYGVHPIALAQHIAQRFGAQQPGRQASAEAVNAMTATVERTASELERFGDFESDVLDIITKNQIKRTNDPSADLKAAYNLARARENRLTPDERLHKRLERVYDKSQRRGK